jgi:TetR/AcrR family transcriptional repressor of nem operon
MPLYNTDWSVFFKSMGKGDRTRHKIIQKVAVLFNQQGYAATSMQDITAATGIKRGGLYNHFASKDELATESFAYATQLLARRLQHHVRAQATPPDQLKALASGFLDLYVNNTLFPCGCPVLNTAIEAKHHMVELRQAAQAAMDQLQSQVIDIAQAGIQQGTLNPEAFTPDALAAVFVSTLEGAMMLSVLYDEGRYLRHAVQHLHSYVDQLSFN